MYEYEDAGLSGVFLTNGYERRQTRYGEATSVHNVGGLTRQIAVALSLRRGRLNGVEFRYVRRAIDLSQSDVAKLFARTEQTIANWEKNNKVPLEASQLLKQLCLRKTGFEQHIALILDQLGIDSHATERIEMKYYAGSNSWESNFNPVTQQDSDVRASRNVIFGSYGGNFQEEEVAARTGFKARVQVQGSMPEYVIEGFRHAGTSTPFSSPLLANLICHSRSRGTTRRARNR